MDELDLGAQFVRQFENRNFRLLGRFIFPGDSSEKVRKSNHVSVAELLYKKVTGVSVFEILTVFHSVRMRYEVPLP